MKVRDLLKMIEQDGWYPLLRKAVIVNTNTLSNPAG